MLELLQKEQQRVCSTKPSRSLKDGAAKLVMDELMEPTTLHNTRDEICKTSGNWA